MTRGDVYALQVHSTSRRVSSHEYVQSAITVVADDERSSPPARRDGVRLKATAIKPSHLNRNIRVPFPTEVGRNKFAVCAVDKLFGLSSQIYYFHGDDR